MKQNLLGRRILVSAIISCLILFLGYSMSDYFGSRKSPVRQMSIRESKKAVKVNQVEYKSRELSLSGLGRVVSENAIDLITEIQGVIQPGQVLLKRGQRFGTGQVLFKVDDTEARLNLSSQKSNFLTAIAQVLPDLKVDFEEEYNKWEGYFNSIKVEEELPDLPEIKESKEKVFLSTRNILNQYYSIKSAEERLSKYVIRAPFSGSYQDVSLEVGSVVNPGNRVARIARSNRLELEVPFKTEDVSFLKYGTKVSVKSEDKGSEWKGRISRIGSSLDPTTQSLNIYVQFNPGSTKIYEGQYLRVDVPITRTKAVMEIPRNALLNRNEVYIVQDSVLKVKPILVEKLNKETLFFSGLDTGTYVVVEPLLSASEDMPVQMNVMVN
ncbi:MAG: efflux RND transporter periplasmic adaptor subunit [Bacteroidota bacterium]